MAHASLLLPSVKLSHDPAAVADGADALLLATEWPAYLRLDWAHMRRIMRGNLVLDGRNVLPGEHLRGLGFDYRSFGRAGDAATTGQPRVRSGERSLADPRSRFATSASARSRTGASADRVA